MYRKIKNNRNFGIFVILTRYLIGFAFIPSGLTKVLGQRFTQISTDTQIGYFFEGLYQSGAYWHFLGLAQLAASFLIMTQRFAAVGSLMFLGIITNIWVITWSMDFRGTVIITSLMLLACLMLVAWHWDRMQYLFVEEGKVMLPMKPSPPQDPIWQTSGLALYFFCLSAFIFTSYYKSESKYVMAGMFVFIIAVLTSSMVISQKRYRSKT